MEKIAVRQDMMTAERALDRPHPTDRPRAGQHRQQRAVVGVADEARQIGPFGRGQVAEHAVGGQEPFIGEAAVIALDAASLSNERQEFQKTGGRRRLIRSPERGRYPRRRFDAHILQVLMKEFIVADSLGILAKFTPQPRTGRPIARVNENK